MNVKEHYVILSSDVKSEISQLKQHVTSIRVPKTLIQNKKLNVIHYLLLSKIYQLSTQNLIPGQHILAYCLGVSKRNIERAIQDLLNMHYIEYKWNKKVSRVKKIALVNPKIFRTRNFIQIPNVIAGHKEITNTAKIVYGAIYSDILNKGYCSATYSDMTDRLRTSKAAFARSLQQLKQYEHIFINKMEETSWSQNIYTINTKQIILQSKTERLLFKHTCEEDPSSFYSENQWMEG